VEKPRGSKKPKGAVDPASSSAAFMRSADLLHNVKWSYVEKMRDDEEKIRSQAVSKYHKKICKAYRLERIAEGAKAMADAMMAETTKKRNCLEKGRKKKERYPSREVKF